MKLGKVGKVGRSWEKSRFWSKVDVDEKNYLILHPTCIDSTINIKQNPECHFDIFCAKLVTELSGVILKVSSPL